MKAIRVSVRTAANESRTLLRPTDSRPIEFAELDHVRDPTRETPTTFECSNELSLIIPDALLG